MLPDSFKSVVIHVNVKKIQSAEFESDKLYPKKNTLQVDYVMAYQ